jgi:hypothetical protein
LNHQFSADATVIKIREQLQNDFSRGLHKLRKEVELFQDAGDIRATEDKSSTVYKL